MEMVVKVLGMGLKSYAMDSMNQFDAIVVIISIVEFILMIGADPDLVVDAAEEEQKSENMSLTIFRGFRLLRVFRLFRKWKTFHKMMVKIGQTLKDIITFFVLLLIIVFVFSLLGVELFGNQIKINLDNEIVPLDDPHGFSPRQNFDSFPEGFVSVFVCLIGEDWQIIMHDYIRSKESRLVPSMYFIFLMILGNLFLMNLFLAILLKNFEEKKTVGQEEEAEHEEETPGFNKSIAFAYSSFKVKIKRVVFNKKDDGADQSSSHSSSEIIIHEGGSDSLHQHEDHHHHPSVPSENTDQREATKLTLAKNYIKTVQA